MSRKLRILSLSGTIAVVHFSLFLVIVGYQRSFAGPDGLVHWTDENRPILEFLEKAMFIHMFPVGWLSALTDWLHWTATDVIVMVVLVAANSALVGYVLVWMLRLVHRKLLRGHRANLDRTQNRITADCERCHRHEDLGRW